MIYVLSFRDSRRITKLGNIFITLYISGMFFLFYLAFGASIFSAIESPIERAETIELVNRKAAFLKKSKCISGAQVGNVYKERYKVIKFVLFSADADLEEFMEDVVKANDNGVSIFRNGTSVSSWSFGQAFFFASTVVTTIGYGHQSPLSYEGKLFCILYAIVGIPMTLLLLAAVVQRCLMPVNALLRWMHEKMGQRYQPVYIYLMHFTLVRRYKIIIINMRHYCRIIQQWAHSLAESAC